MSRYNPKSANLSVPVHIEISAACLAALIGHFGGNPSIIIKYNIHCASIIIYVRNHSKIRREPFLTHLRLELLRMFFDSACVPRKDSDFRISGDSATSTGVADYEVHQNRPYFCRAGWGILRLVEVRKLNYRNGMTEPIQTGLPQALRIWRSRQKADGFLVAGVLAIAFGTLLFFIVQPSQVAATVMVVSLVALALACARLIQSAASVVRIRSTIRMQVAVADSVQPTNGSSLAALN